MCRTPFSQGGLQGPRYAEILGHVVFVRLPADTLGLLGANENAGMRHKRPTYCFNGAPRSWQISANKKMDKKTGPESSLTGSLLECVLGLRGATGWTSLESYVDDLLDVGELQPNPGAAGTDMALSEMFKQLKMHAGTERSWLVGSVASLQMLLCFSITSRTPERFMPSLCSGIENKCLPSQ